MKPRWLPYLSHLKTAVANLVPTTGAEPASVVQAAVATRLIDFMMAEDAVARDLRTVFVESLQVLLPQIEAAFGASGGAQSHTGVDAIRELRESGSSTDLPAFNRVLELAAEIQRKLLALQTPQALALCKSIAQIECAYARSFDAAVAAQAAAAASSPEPGAGGTVYDKRALLAFVRQTFPDESKVGIASIAVVSGGYSKATASVTLENASALPTRLILRRDIAATFGGASVVDEYHLVRTLFENGVCVPEPFALDATGTVLGSPFMLVEHKPGQTIGNLFRFPDEPNKPVSDDIASKLAAIHCVPLQTIGDLVPGANLSSSARARLWIDEAIANWSPLNMASPVFATALEWLQRHVALNDDAPRALVHGDFGLNNLLVMQGKVTAVLDWEFAHVGNPGYDLGYFYFTAQRLSSWQAFLQAYVAAGMALPEETQLNYNILFAATRVGVMVCQMRAAFDSGAVSGVAAAGLVGGNCYEEVVMRISAALDRIL